MFYVLVTFGTRSTLLPYRVCGTQSGCEIPRSSSDTRMLRCGMRKTSKKRSLLNAKASETRKGLVEKHGSCMICGVSPGRPNRTRPLECSQLCCHEIANGPLRSKALDKPYAILVLCWYCNQYEVTNKKIWPESRQLSILKAKSDDYDLTRYNTLVNPRAPDRITAQEVEQWTTNN